MAFSNDVAAGLFTLKNTVSPHLEDDSREELCRLLQELFSEYKTYQVEEIETDEWKSNN